MKKSPERISAPGILFFLFHKPFDEAFARLELRYGSFGDLYIALPRHFFGHGFLGFGLEGSEVSERDLVAGGDGVLDSLYHGLHDDIKVVLGYDEFCVEPLFDSISEFSLIHCRHLFWPL